MKTAESEEEDEEELVNLTRVGAIRCKGEFWVRGRLLPHRAGSAIVLTVKPALCLHFMKETDMVKVVRIFSSF